MNVEPPFCMRVLFGLGNPGKEYQLTRHNCGFLVVEAFAKDIGSVLQEQKSFQAQCVKGMYQGQQIDLCLPQTYMNNSGQSVARYMQYFRHPIHTMLVVVDDLALPFGQLRLKRFGGSGGHNGLRSIENMLHTTQYARLRVGIGKSDKIPQADYVLQRFNEEELSTLETYINRAVNVIKSLFFEPFEIVAGRLHRDNSLPINSKKEKSIETKQEKA